jgi:hypothetical protein
MFHKQEAEAAPMLDMVLSPISCTVQLRERPRLSRYLGPPEREANQGKTWRSGPRKATKLGKALAPITPSG